MFLFAENDLVESCQMRDFSRIEILEYVILDMIFRRDEGRVVDEDKVDGWMQDRKHQALILDVLV